MLTITYNFEHFTYNQLFISLVRLKKRATRSVLRNTLHWFCFFDQRFQALEGKRISKLQGTDCVCYVRMHKRIVEAVNTLSGIILETRLITPNDFETIVHTSMMWTSNFKVPAIITPRNLWLATLDILLPLSCMFTLSLLAVFGNIVSCVFSTYRESLLTLIHNWTRLNLFI